MGTEAPVSVLAFVTTLHIALLLLLKHWRSPGGHLSSLLVPSFLLTFAPWFLKTPVWLASAFLVHAAWLLACERLVPKPAAPAARPGPARPAKAPAQAQSSVLAPLPARPQDFQEVQVLAVFDETPEIRTFRFIRPEGFDFRPGQFLMIRVPIEGRTHARCYSISSAPEASGYLEISVRRQGLVSAVLHERLRVGGSVEIKGPGGNFVYPSDSNLPMVLLAGGVGITPLVSMLRHAAVAQPLRPVTLLFGVRTEADVAFRDELRLLATRFPNVRVAVALSRASEVRGYLTGRIDAKLIQRAVPHPEEAVHLICGPGPMIESTREALASLGVPAPQVRYEAFGAAVESANAAAAADPSQEFSLKLTKSGRVVKVSAGKSLLEAAEDAGAEVPSLCRAGSCGTCRTRLVSGEVEATGDALDPADREKGYILPCVAWARGDCSLDA